MSIKIKKEVFFAVIAAVFAAVSIHPLFFLKDTPWLLFGVYIILGATALFFTQDVKIEKKTAARLVFFTAGALVLAAGQYIFSFYDHRLILYGTAAYAAGIALIAASAFKTGESPPSPPAVKIKPIYEISAVILLFAAALALRLVLLGSLLPGIWFDEAMNGFETIRLLNEKSIHVFVERFTNMPAMFFYLASIPVKAGGLSIEAVRIMPAFFGALTVAGFYFLLKQIFKSAMWGFFGAFMLAFSGWHITFSRVGFLGMLAMFLAVVFLYFYLRTVETGKTGDAAAAGLSLGLAQYTFTAANLLLPIAGFHLLYLLFFGRRMGKTLKGRAVTVMVLVFAVVIIPLAHYALNSKGKFLRRAGDVSILADVKNNSIAESLKRNIRVYGLSFHFEGDYNGRHNLYKKPHLDHITGVLFAAGIGAAAMAGAGLFFLWFIVMMSAGLLTVTIEAPQAYRILCVIPVIYIFVIFGLRHFETILAQITGKKRFFPVILAAIALVSAVVNVHRYFVLYPAHEATYMSFAPEANKAAEIILRERNYYPFVSAAKKMYGYYGWEQKVIADFVCYEENIKYSMNAGEPPYKIGRSSIEGRDGIVFIMRPSDEDANRRIEREFNPGKKEEYINPYSKEPIIICYYVPAENILSAAENNYVYIAD
ncbi:MAG TPA: glycosyltransferase family 39 protein [bacterium]|nr:glycosyltransferase family 39 protein [bacterium]